MNRNCRIGIAASVVAAILIAVPVYLYWAYGTTESMYRRGLAAPFWTTLENDTREVVIMQGETKTIPVELHYWKNLRTALGIKFEVPDTEQGGLYNSPDGLEISFNLDDAYIHVDNGKIVEIFSHRDIELKEPSEIQQRFEGADLVVAEDVGSITISASREVPAGEYVFGIATTDSNVNSQYGGNSQSVVVTVVDGVTEQDNGGAPASNDSKTPAPVECQQSLLCTYQLTAGNSTTYPINFRMNGTIMNMIAYPHWRTLTIELLKAERPTTLQIAIPREVVDSRAGEDGRSGADEPFAVFIDDKNVDLDEYSTSDSEWAQALGVAEHPEEYRILVISIQESAETVEVIGALPI